VGPKAVLEAVVKRKIPSPRRKHKFSALQASRFHLCKTGSPYTQHRDVYDPIILLIKKKTDILLMQTCRRQPPRTLLTLYWAITNDVSDYINLLLRIAHIICNEP
jgi:hypothetical protein